MATLVNTHKFGKGGPPEELASKLPPELVTSMMAASAALDTSESSKGAVMAHGIAPKVRRDGRPFTTDNNYHFFSHAYLAASLLQEHGMPSHRAEATSGFIGAQYELQAYSLGEGSGNAGLKDILMNAEGAAFGSGLVDEPGRLLPNAFSGPATEDRGIKTVPTNELPPGVQQVADDAGDMSLPAKIFAAFQGGLGRKIDNDVETVKKLPIPLNGSPHP